MDQMQILGLVALGAGIAKAAILAFSHAGSRLASAFLLLCISMILQNAFEFLVSITYYSNPALATYLLHGVMLSLNFLTLSLLYFTLTVVQSRYSKILTTVFAVWGLLAAGLLLSGNLVTGYEQVEYTVISIPTNLYPVFTIYVLAAVAFMFSLLTYSSFTASPEIRERSRQVLLAIAPICLIGLAVQLLKAAGFNASTAVFMPIATTFFVGMMVLYQSGRIVIFKIKWTVICKLAISMRDVKLSEWVELVEELLVKEAMRVSANNQTDAAKLIKSNQTTVGRKFKKYQGEDATQEEKIPEQS